MWPLSRKLRAAASLAPADDAAVVRPDDAAVRSIEAVIRRFLGAYRPAGRGRQRLAATANLWTEVSSLTMLQLVAFIEQKFAIKVRPIDFAPQNFSSIAAIARFVAAHRPPAADIPAAEER